MLIQTRPLRQRPTGADKISAFLTHSRGEEWVQPPAARKPAGWRERLLAGSKGERFGTGWGGNVGWSLASCWA